MAIAGAPMCRAQLVNPTYLNFINIFQLLLSFMGQREE
jgi:hypothetical protein